MRIGSLFSGGCGGLELGLERAGVGHVVWQCEIDPAARRNLARHWPGVRQYTDVKEMNHGNTERVDVICGGSPCQDLSFAGKGDGLAGARSGLWFEYLRLVRELRPRYVVIENVPALVTRGLGVVLGGLAEAGYDAVWFTLRAADVGATHLRERLFVVAYRHGEGQPRPEGVEPGEPGWVGDGGGDVGHAHGARLEGRGVRGRERADERALGAPGAEVGGSFPPGPDDLGQWRNVMRVAPHLAPAYRNKLGNWTLSPAFTEWHMGLPEDWTQGTRSERLKQLGNAVVPQCAEVVGHVLLGLRP